MPSSPAAAVGLVAVALACATLVTIRAHRIVTAARAAMRRAEALEAHAAATARRLAEAARASKDAVCDEIAAGIRRAVPAVDGVLIYEREEDALRCTFASGARFAYYLGTTVAAGDAGSPIARALRAGARVTLRDLAAAAVHRRDHDLVAVPFAVEDRPAAVLAVAAPRMLAPRETDCIVALADHAAPAFAIALDRERDRRAAEYDGLTGLLTPRAFRRRLAALVERGRFVPARELALIFVDTDRFKQWNDTRGHAAGDRLLRAIAAVLRAAARGDEDLAARNGGDEFCVVLSGLGKAAAIERAEALRRAIASATPVTASIGVAAYPADARDASELLERADAAMYHAKAGGRNGVAYAAQDGTPVRLDETPLR